MGNVPISCCRSKSPRLDSEFHGNGSNAQFSSSYDSRKLSSRTGRHDCDPSSSTSSMHQSAQNILQHISEREPDDTESDPSSNPSNRPIFAQRSSRNQQCKLNNSGTQDSYSSTNSSMVRKSTLNPLTTSQDHGYNSGASTNLTYQDCSFDSSSQQQLGENLNQQSQPRSYDQSQNLLDDSFGTSQASDCGDQALKNTAITTNNRLQSSYSRRLYTSRKQGEQSESQAVEDCMKASSCSTIFIDNSTISQPNLDQTIKCVSLAIYYHIKSRSSDAAANIFDETLHPLRMPTIPQELVMSNNPQQQHQQQSSIPPLKCMQNEENPKHEDAPTILDSVSRTGEPDQETIYSFVRTLFKSAQLTSEYAITTLVYLERLMTYAEMDLTPRTWRRMFLGAILLSSKVWEDQAIWNVDYAQILEEISVDDINELERQFLELIQFNMNVPSSVYAKYYFHLRTLAIQNGLMGDQTLLTTGQAKELEAMSKVHTTDDWFSSPIHRKSPPAIKKHTSLEKLRLGGNAKAVLM